MTCIELPTLTPNSLQFVGTTILPDLEPDNEKNRELRKRAKSLEVPRSYVEAGDGIPSTCVLYERNTT